MEVFVNYDACGDSQHGIGAELSHKIPDGTEKPLAFTSTTLNISEIKYSHFYLISRILCIVNDI